MFVQVLAFLLLPTALILACLGIEWAARRAAGYRADGLALGARVVCGLAIFTAIGGWFVAARAYSSAVALSLVGIGCLALAIGWQKPSPAGLRKPAAAWLAAFRSPWFLFAAAFAAMRAAGALRFPSWNYCDDWATYLHFPRLLLESGGFEEPFNMRRLGVLGSGPFMQGFFWSGFGVSALPISDAVVGQLAVWGGALAVRDEIGTGGDGIARRGAGLAVVALLASLTIPIFNSSPTLLPFGGALVLFALSADLARREPSERGIYHAVLWGLVAAWLIGLRTSNAIVPGSIWLLELATAVARGDRPRLRRSAIAALACGCALLPWALSIWRSSGTPLFPLVTGNYRFDGLFTAPLSTAQVGSFVVDCLLANRAWAVALLAAVAMLGSSQRRIAAQVAVAAVGLVIAMALSMTAFDTYTVYRYGTPFVTAAVLFLITVLWLEPVRPAFGWQKAAALSIAIGWLLVPASTRRNYQEVRASNWTAALAGANMWYRAAASAARAGFSPERVSGAQQYAEALSRLPSDARLVSAVEKPFHWSFASQTIHTLDAPGQASPGGGMPFFSGSEAVADYLVAEGYSHLAFTPPNAGVCLYSGTRWRRQAGSGAYLWRTWAPYFLDFMSTEGLLRASRLVVYESNELVVLDLRTTAAPAARH